MHANQLWARKVLWILGGAMCVVVGVNMTMMVIARRSFSGLVTTQAYEKGLAYNSQLAARAAQQRLGWNIVRYARHAGFGYRVTGPAGHVLPGLKIIATMTRPLENMPPRMLTFVETAAGQYDAQIHDLTKGQWEVNAEFSDGRQVFRLTDRVFLP